MIIKRENGITLIALVVTIIVLIILAGISIDMILGNNGILTKTRQGRNNYEVAANEEKDSLARLYTEMETHIGENPSDENESYWEQIMETAQKHPNQKASDDIGIDAYGKIINLDLWSYEEYSNGYKLIDLDGSSGSLTGYLPLSNDWNSSKLYTASINKYYAVCPKYIKKAGTNSFKEVIGIGAHCFANTNIKKIVIPDTIKTIEEYAFGDCKMLKSLEIPSTVTNIGERVLETSSVKKLKVSSNIETTSFYYTNLTSVTFGEGCNLIESGAFRNSNKLYKICFESSTLVSEIYNGNFSFGSNCPVDTVLIKQELYDESKNNISINFGDSNNKTFNFKSIADGYAIYMEGDTSNYNPQDDIEENLEYDLGNDSVYYPPYDPNYNQGDGSEGSEGSEG